MIDTPDMQIYSESVTIDIFYSRRKQHSVEESIVWNEAVCAVENLYFHRCRVLSSENRQKTFCRVSSQHICVVTVYGNFYVSAYSADLSRLLSALASVSSSVSSIFARGLSRGLNMALKRKRTTAATSVASKKKAKPEAAVRRTTKAKSDSSSTDEVVDGFRVYGYKPCSTCRNALKWLDARDIPHESIEITKTPPNAAEMASVAETLGRAAVLNMNGNSAKKIGKAKLEAMSDADAFARVSKDGMLCKRPFLIGTFGGKTIHLTGFKVAEWEAAFKK